MSTITLPNIRVSSDLTVKVRLKDSGVAIDWSTLTKIKASIYSDAQRALAGRCDVSIDAEDSTLLVCSYAANKPQYVGVNRIVVSAKYMGETKTYDKPAFTFVRWTADQEGEQITIDDPDVDVEIDVEDISSSILQEAVDAAFEAADRANDAAAAAEHMVDIHTGPEGKSAYEVAVEEGYVGTEEEWLASLVGPQGAQGIQGETGEAAGFGSVSAALQEDGGDPSVVVAASGEDTSKNFAFTFKNLKGDKGDKGDQGNTGSSVDYPYELVNNLTTNDATKGLSAAQGYVLDGKVSQLEAEVDGLDYTTNDADVHQVNTSSTVETTSGTRLRLLFYVYPGAIVSASCSLGSGLAGGVYSTRDNAVIAGDTGLLQALSSVYIHSLQNAVISAEGYLSISLKKSDGSSFSAQEKEQYLADTIVSITKDGLAKNVDDLREKTNTLSETVETKAYSWNNSIIGNGNEYVTKNIVGFVPGRKYLLVLKNTTWDMDGVTSQDGYKWKIDNSYNGSLNKNFGFALVGVAPTTVEKQYILDIPSNSDFVRIGIRAAKDEAVYFNFFDITEIATVGPEVSIVKNNIGDVPPAQMSKDLKYSKENSNFWDSYSASAPYISNYNNSPFFVDSKKQGLVTSFTALFSSIGNLTIGKVKKTDVIPGQAFDLSKLLIRSVYNIASTGEQTVSIEPFFIDDTEMFAVGATTDTAKFLYGGNVGDGGFKFVSGGIVSSSNNRLGITFNGFTYIFNYIVSTYKDKRISILGDSISTFAGYIPEGNATYYPAGTVQSVQDTWWKKLIDALGLVLDTNNSWSGSRVTTTGGETSAGCMSRSQSLGSPDVIIVWMGINDFNNEVALGTYDGKSEIPTATTTFREAYGIMLNKILTAYPSAEVWVCTLPQCERNGTTGFPEVNGNGVALLDFNIAIEELARAFGVKVLDHNRCGLTYQNMSVFNPDQLHPNKYGHSLVANNDIRQMDNRVSTRYAIAE